MSKNPNAERFTWNDKDVQFGTGGAIVDGVSVGEHLESHPDGPERAARDLAAAHKRGDITFEAEPTARDMRTLFHPELIADIDEDDSSGV